VAAESGDDVAQIEDVGVRGECDRGSLRTEHRGGPIAWVDHNDERHTACDVTLDLGSHFARPVVWRQNFDHQIRCALDKPTSTTRGHALAPEERDIGPSDRVGIRGQLEPNLSADHTDGLLLQVTIQQETDPQHDPAVVEIDRAPANEPAFHKFVAVAVVGQPCQFLCGDQTCALEHCLVSSHGILASS
jgi:hypothetical protein